MPITIPVNKPTITEAQIPYEFSNSRYVNIKYEKNTISTELKLIDLDNEFNNSFCVALFFAFTTNIPAIERIIPIAATSIGAITALNCIVGLLKNAEAPRAAVAKIEPQ